MDTTTNLNLPIPNENAVPPTNISAEFPRIALAFMMLDTIIHTLQGVVAGKANSEHSQAMSTITGLVEALASKMPANATFTLDDLQDVQGAAAAAVNYVLVKNAEGKWVPSSALAAIGEHEHSIAQVVGLADLLEYIAESLANKADNNDLLGLVSETAAQTLSNKTLAAPLVNAPQGEFLRGAGNGLIMANDVADPNNGIVFAPGSFASDGATPVLMTLASALTKRLDVAWAVGNNQGGLDTGTKAINTWYHPFEIQRSDTGIVDVLLSANPSSPAMPSAAWNRKRRLRGAIRTNASGNIIPFVHLGDDYWWSNRAQDVSAAASNSAQVVQISVPPGRKVIAKLLLKLEFSRDNALFLTARVSDPDTPDVAPSTDYDPMVRFTGGVAGSIVTQSFYLEVPTNAAGQVRYRCGNATSGSTLQIATLGWREVRD